MIATYQWQSQMPSQWENLKRYRFEFGLAVAALAIIVAIWVHLDRREPTSDQIEQSLQTYVQQLRSSRSLNGGSLRLEMQADVTGPRITRLDVTKLQSFIDYWTIDAVMQVENISMLSLSVPIRLRVVQHDGVWVVVEAEDLSHQALLR